MAGVGADHHPFLLLRGQKSVGDHALNLRQKRIIKAIRVDDANGLSQATQLRAAPHVAGFFQRADAARQHKESIGQLGKAVFALGHGGDHFAGMEARMHQLARFEVFGDDALHRAAGFQRGIGDDTHQAAVPAAVDQREAALGDGTARLHRGLFVGGVIAGIGTTKDCDRFHFLCPECAKRFYLPLLQSAPLQRHHVGPFPAFVAYWFKRRRKLFPSLWLPNLLSL